MGWVWIESRDKPAESVSTSGDGAKFNNPSSLSSGDRRSTRKAVKSQCRTEEVEPGKFLRKCERTEEVLMDCIGRPVEVIQSNKEYTEEDVTNEMVNRSFSPGSSEHQPFDFPGLRGDVEGIEHSTFDSMNGVFEIAEDSKNDYFSSLKDPSLFKRESSSYPSMRQGVPNEDHEPGLFYKPNNSDSGHVGADLSRFARDV